MGDAEEEAETPLRDRASAMSLVLMSSVGLSSMAANAPDAHPAATLVDIELFPSRLAPGDPCPPAVADDGPGWFVFVVDSTATAMGR